MAKIRILQFIFYCIFCVVIVHSKTWFGGYYETEYVVDEQSDFTWNLRLPRHYLLLKLWSNPVRNFEIYTEGNAWTNEPWVNRIELGLNKFWGKYWLGKGEIIYGIKEDRHFINSPLLQLVNIDKVTWKRGWWDTPQGQVLRLDFWDIGPLKFTGVISKDEKIFKKEWYGNYFDQEQIEYLSKLSFRAINFPDANLNFSVGYLSQGKKIDKFNPVYDIHRNLTGYNFERSTSLINNVYTGDITFFTPYGNFITEYACNENNKDYVFDIEFRDIVLGPIKFLTRYYDYSKTFRCEMSEKFSARKIDYSLKLDPEFSRKGWSTEIVYLFPYKTINFTYKGNFYNTELEKVKDEPSVLGLYDVIFTTVPYRVNSHYGEIYTEFIYGLKSKIAFEHYTDRYGSFPSIFCELQGDSRVGFARIQTRLKDINSTKGLGERFIVGIDLRFNVTDRLQLYTRGVSVQSNYKSKTWSSMFYQLRYNIFPDVEGYLEYGDGWATDWLTFDNDIVENENIGLRHTIKLIVKVNF